jgi:hypothetical protein
MTDAFASAHLVEASGGQASAGLPVTVAPVADGAKLLEETYDALTRYVVFPDGAAAVAVTLWIAASHAQPAWEHATRLAIKSPVKRCGKSRLLDLAEALCHQPLPTVNVSVAALVRSINEDDPPTLLLDEADTIFGKRRGERAEAAEDLRGILNAGHKRGGKYRRWDQARRQPEECPTFSMAALAGIGDLPDTIEDRAVIVTMRRRAPGEQVSSFRRRRDLPALVTLRDRLHGWLRDHLAELETATPAMPVEDRAADTWEPLVAVADLAGGDWPDLARDACRTMTAQASADDDGSLGERLLADLREVFADDDRLDSRTILERLHSLEEAPWADLYSKGLDARGLARLLRPYGVRPKVLRLGTATPRGYERADLLDPWQRYTPERNERNMGNILGHGVAHVADAAGSATGRNALTSDVGHVADVADTPPDPGDGRLPGVDHRDPGRFAE